MLLFVYDIHTGELVKNYYVILYMVNLQGMQILNCNETKKGCQISEISVKN